MKTKIFSQFILAVTILTALVLPALAAPPPYYVAGDFNGWNAAGNLMTETSAGSGIWQVSLNMSIGRHEFKITEGDWAWTWPGPNSWLYADGSGNVTITFDANTYADGWSGNWGRIGVNVDPGTWTAVGDWQGWSTNNPSTVMPPEGGGIYGLQYFIASPGTYQYKAVDTGSWDAIGSDARSVNANTLYFTTAYSNQPVVFSVNATNGTIKTDILPPLPCVGTNMVKFYLLPQLYQGYDVLDSRNNIILADDFQCTSSGPITDIHIWGSWSNNVVGIITNFWIGIYSDVPAGTNYVTPQVTNSHPGVVLWWTNFPQGGQVYSGVYTNYAYENFYNPLNGSLYYDSVVYYYCFYPKNPFIQQGSPNAPTNYWLAIRAQQPNDGTFFGWKSAATPYNDPAVWITAGGIPGSGANWKSMTNPLINLSMVITTSNASPVTDTNKWTQMPDTSTNGLDVKATAPKVLADDFLCKSTGPITEVRIWGSWNFDNYPTTVTQPPCFNLGIWTDVPRQGTIPSHPGLQICNWFFNGGQYTNFPYTTNVNEFFFDPNIGTYIGMDHVIWEYIFDWPTNYPCIQTNGNIYWLSVSADCFDTNIFTFGWKTCPTNWNDDAAWADVPAFGAPPTSWNELRRPPYFTNSLDMAFQIITTPSTNPPPQTNCCPETNTVKWVQYPNLTNGMDVLASFNPIDNCVGFGWVLADDFPCTNSGAITDIHLWGSWWNNVIDTSAVFTLSIWSDVPTVATGGFSHPGNLLWSQYYVAGQYGICVATNLNEIFADGIACPPFAFTTNLYHLCFPVPLPSNPSNIFYQTGTVYVKTNYWLSVTVQGTNYFGWKTSGTVYNDYAVGAANGAFFPAPGDWFQITDPTSDLLNMAFMIGTATNACTTPPQLQCSDLIVSCTNLTWLPPVPVVIDPCCPSGGVPSMSGSFTISNCPTVYKYFWSYTNCQGLTAFCSSYVTVTSAPPVLLPTNVTIMCGSPIPTNPPGVIAPCCSNTIVPFLVNSYTNGNMCSNIIYQVWKAIDCNCTNLTAVVTQTVTVVDITPPVITCASNKVVQCGTNWSFDPPTASDACCGANVTITVVSTVTNGSCPWVITQTWKATDCCSNSSTCSQTVTVVDTIPPVITCASNKTVQCGTNWSFDLPTASDACCGTNVSITVVSTVTNGSCPWVITRTWQATDCCSNRATCSQTVTMVDTIPPTIICASNKTVVFGTPWTFDPPTASDQCCSNVTITVLSTVTNGTGCNLVITRTWQAVDCCSNSAFCSQVVTVVCPPMPCVESNGVKYAQMPNLYGGLDVWNNGQWMLADDFVCTNTGPISDIHIWGSWLNNAVGTNTLTFWLAIYDDVPFSSTNSYSHPGNLLWQQWFSPGQYAENYSTYGSENFLNPEPSTIIGPDSQVWYYCFYPKAPLFQNGSATTPKIYWLVAYAKPPTNNQFQYGWKTAQYVQNDISVHAAWPGMPPTNNPTWIPTHDPQNVPLDLAFKITTDTNYNNIMKYIQWPNTNYGAGYDVWNSSTKPQGVIDGPWVLADDFVCTNTGYITDIHLWGSWLNNSVTTNSITFWIGLFTDVPASQGSVGQSHPGHCFWSQCFPPGTYFESPGAYASENFLDPGPPAVVGFDNQVWYYSFYPTNRPIQWGSATNPMIYWVGAFAQQSPVGLSGSFGWKTTTNVQHDISVHAPWPFGQCPTNVPDWTNGWTATYSDVGHSHPLDLAFEISTVTNCSQTFITIDRISTTTVQVQWLYGTLQWSTNLLTPIPVFQDVPGATPPFFRDTCFPTYPTNRFYRVRCD